MEHNFNIEVARLYGIEEAILVHNLFFWIKKNVANGKHYYDGRCWTYNSAKAFAEYFPYLSDTKIYRVLSSLEEKGFIVKGNYNTDRSDRTKWYAFTDKGLEKLRAQGYDVSGFSSNLQNEEMQFAKMQNAICENENSILINNTDSKNTDDKQDIKELKEKFESFVKKYKKAGGRVRGVDTEFNDFSKRHKDWKEIIPYLNIALEKEMKEREMARIGKKFYPEMKNLQTYLGKKRAWEMYVTVGEDISNEYIPTGHNVFYDELRGFYYYSGMFFDSNDIMDGYNDKDRPDGVKLCLNNGR